MVANMRIYIIKSPYKKYMYNQIQLLKSLIFASAKKKKKIQLWRN